VDRVRSDTNNGNVPMFWIFCFKLKISSDCLNSKKRSSGKSKGYQSKVLLSSEFLEFLHRKSLRLT